MEPGEGNVPEAVVSSGWSNGNDFTSPPNALGIFPVSMVKTVEIGELPVASQRGCDVISSTFSPIDLAQIKVGAGLCLLQVGKQ